MAHAPNICSLWLKEFGHFLASNFVKQFLKAIFLQTNFETKRQFAQILGQGHTLERSQQEFCLDKRLTLAFPSINYLLVLFRKDMINNATTSVGYKKSRGLYRLDLDSKLKIRARSQEHAPTKLEMLGFIWILLRSEVVNSLKGQATSGLH